MTENTITFQYQESLGQSKPIMTLSQYGIWADPEIPCDEAAKKVLEAMNSSINYMVQAAILAEREACAKVCDEFAKDSDWPTADNCAESIRARGQA